MNNANKTHRFRAWFDGSITVNPGGIAAYGAVIYEGNQRVYTCSKIYHPPAGKERQTSCNVAEYLGLIAVLEWLLANGHASESVIIRGDSKLVIAQCFEGWKPKRGIYFTHALKAKELLQQLPHVSGKWIPREKNTIADKLSKVKNAK